MSKFLLSITLALALSALGASSALAEAPEGAQKAPLFGPEAGLGTVCGVGAVPTPETFGSVVLNTPGHEKTLSGEVALKGAEPDATFEVIAVEAQAGPFCVLITPVGEITTNKTGNGNLHFTTIREPTATKFWVLLKTTEVFAFASPAVELD